MTVETKGMKVYRLGDLHIHSGGPRRVLKCLNTNTLHRYNSGPRKASKSLNSGGSRKVRQCSSGKEVGECGILQVGGMS